MVLYQCEGISRVDSGRLLLPGEWIRAKIITEIDDNTVVVSLLQFITVIGMNESA